MTDTVLDAATDDLVDVPELAEPSVVLPSERLYRLVELAATALKVAGPAGSEGPVLTEQALAYIWTGWMRRPPQRRRPRTDRTGRGSPPGP